MFFNNICHKYVPASGAVANGYQSALGRFKQRGSNELGKVKHGVAYWCMQPCRLAVL